MLFLWDLKNKKMKKLLLLAAFCLAVCSNAQTTIYNADFSNDGDGFTDHTTSLPPVAGPTSVGPFGVLPNSWELSYTTTPNTDGSANSFKVVAGELQSDDWGGQGIFTSQNIDVSAISLANISAIGVNSGANDDNFTYFYILDGGPRVETSIGVSNNGDPVNYSILNLDVSGATTLTVGFEFSENGGGDGYDISLFEVTGSSTATNTPPSITNIIQSPDQTILDTDDVTISATITDTDGVASAQIEYGFASGMLNETPIIMTNVGDDYSGDIPAQADGTEVFYQIVAIDSNAMPATTTSTELSYTVMNPLPAPSLIITEVADPSDDFNGRFVEIYNNGMTAIDFSTTTVFIARQSNGNNISSTPLTGTINPGQFYVIGNSSNLSNVYGIPADLDFGSITGNGDDGYFLYVGGDENSGSLFDSYGELGQDGTGEAWEYEDSRATRNSLVDVPSSVWVAANWTITSAIIADMTPGAGEPNDYIYDGTSWSPVAPEGVSTTSDNIIVNAGSVSFTGDVDGRSLIVNAGSLDLGSNTVNLTRDVTVDAMASISGDDATLNLSGVATQQVTLTNLILENLILNNANGAALNGSIDLEGILTLTNGNLITNDNLTLKSTLGTSAVVGEVTSGTITGDVTVEQFYPARRAFRFVSSPVDMTGTIFDNWQQAGLNPGDAGYEAAVGTQITGGTTGGFDISSSNNPSAFNFSNDSTQSWNSLFATNDGTAALSAGNPVRILVRGDRSVDLTINDVASETTLVTTGALKINDVTQDFDASLSTGDFIFTGNPYQSKVDVGAMIFDAATSDQEDINPNFMYVWNPQAGTRGAYRAYDFSTSSSTPIDVEVTGVLQPGQAMFLEVLDDADMDVPSITFKESFKVTGSDVTATYSLPQAILSLDVLKSNNIALDGLRINFNANGNNAVDYNDLNKIQNLDENIAISNGTNQLAIESRDLPVDGSVIPLQISGFTSGTYDFNINMRDINNLNTYLFDAHVNQYIAINNNSASSISLSFDTTNPSSIALDRFSIIFSNGTLSNNTAFAEALSIYPNPVNNGLVKVNGLSGNEPVIVELFNMSGQLLLSKTYSTDNNEVLIDGLDNLNLGVYLLSLQQNNRKLVQQIIIE